MSIDYNRLITLIHPDNEQPRARHHLALSVAVASLDRTLLDLVLWLEDRIYQADGERWENSNVFAFQEVWNKIFGREIDLEKLRRERSTL